MSDEISSIKIQDLEILLEVSRAKSIREVARRMNTTPGRISKAVQKLEARLGTKLYKRSVSGVLPTAQGAEIMAIADTIVRSGEQIKELLSGQGKSRVQKTFALASTSFLNVHFTAPATCRLADQLPDHSFRFLDLAPDQLVPVALRGAFEIAVHTGKLNWPSTWVTMKLGKTRWALTARADHPIGRKPSIRQILEYAFVYPVYWTPEGLTKGNDHFPIPVSKRRIGYETATADAAIPILMETDQLAFLPEILVRPFIERKHLRIIETSEVSVIEKDVFLTVRSDIVPDSLFKDLARALSKMIER